MNTTRFDMIKSFDSGDTLSFVVLFSAEIFILPFYTGWIVYFLSEIFNLKRRIRALVYRGPSSEPTRLYKCRGDYYKNILMFILAVIEPISLLPVIISFIPNSTQQISNDFRLLTFVLSFAIIFFFNTLTKHLINVCKSDYRIQLLPPIQHRLVILALIMMILAVIKLAIQDFDNVIVQILCNIFASYEFYYIIKNSKQLYNLLKWRYEDMRLEPNYPLYKAHKRMALKYKYLTIYLMFGISFQIAAGWVDIPLTMFAYILRTPIPLNLDVLLAFKVLKWFNILLGALSSNPQFLVVAVTLYYIAAVCMNRIGWRSGRNRIRYLVEPILQQESS